MNKKFKKLGNSRYIYQNKLNKSCFQKIWLMEILRICPRTASDEVLCDKAFDIAKNPKYDRYQKGIALKNK